MREPIRKITRKDGTTAYRVVVNAGKHPDGRRRQITATYDRLRDARSELARIRREIDLGTHTSHRLGRRSATTSINGCPELSAIGGQQLPGTAPRRSSPFTTGSA